MIDRRLLRSVFSLKGNFAEGRRPHPKDLDGVSVAPFWDDRPAAAVVSADFELNWAWRELPPAARDAKGRLERANFPVLMSLLTHTGVPVTWATVGHMFLESCDRASDGRAHVGMPRPPRNDRWEGDWYRHDPCTNAVADPLWYSPDLIEELIASGVPHEIASHSFSHIDFSARYSTPELVEHEMQACRSAMEPFGLRPRSLVYPFNRMGHGYLGLLASLGVVAVRHRDAQVRLSYPERTPSGIYKLYETLNLRRARFYDYVTKAELFIEEAMRRRCAFHIWFHPSAQPEVLASVFTPIVELIARLRDSGSLWAATMADIAAYCEARHSVALRVRRSPEDVLVSIDNAAYDRRRYGVTSLTFVIACERPPRTALVSDGTLTHAVDTRPSRGGGPLAVVATVPLSARSLRLLY